MRVRILVAQYVCLASLLFMSGSYASTEKVSVDLTPDFARKLLALDARGGSVKEVFKAYSVGFGPDARVALEVSDSGNEYSLVSYNSPPNNQLVLAVCTWFNMYSIWFDAGMLLPNEERTLKARLYSIMGVEEIPDPE